MIGSEPNIYFQNTILNKYSEKVYWRGVSIRLPNNTARPKKHEVRYFALKEFKLWNSCQDVFSLGRIALVSAFTRSRWVVSSTSPVGMRAVRSYVSKGSWTLMLSGKKQGRTDVNASNSIAVVFFRRGNLPRRLSEGPSNSGSQNIGRT